MPPRDQIVPIEQLLAAARQRVLATSLRAVAAEIGMEHSGLNKLLQGTTPRPSTIEKLTTWYLRHAGSGELDSPPELVEAALAILVQHLPPGRRVAATKAMRVQLRELTDAAGVRIPSWLTSPAGKKSPDETRSKP
jgi:hypothetical protein